jgi:hypothetical protein
VDVTVEAGSVGGVHTNGLFDLADQLCVCPTDVVADVERRDPGQVLAP